MPKEKQKRHAQTILTCAALGALTISLAGCIAYPDPPPPPGVAVAPAYYPGPYSYYNYPAYYGPAYYGPPVGVGIGIGEGGGWRGRWH